MLRVPVSAVGGPTMLEIEQTTAAPTRLQARVSSGMDRKELLELARRVVFADLDLRPFYRCVGMDQVLGPIAAALHGLKPLRPPTVFEAAIIAITEQQLSLTAAYRIRARLVQRLGEPVEDLWVFPSPARFAAASQVELAACGLSRQKIAYAKALAQRTDAGGLDLENLAAHPDDEIRARLREIAGLGPWSAEYLLLRGFGRPSGLPSTDVSLQKVVGHYLCGGRTLSARMLEAALFPFRPFAGLAAFYLSVAYRVSGSGPGA
jgi:DNA-3-methyladenine glycosylase II